MDVPTIDPLWVSALVTFVLVVITSLYMRETRKIRLESLRPSFSLRTGMYTIGGGIHQLLLRNMGGVARDVEIDVEISASKPKKFFAPSLYSNQEVDLEINVQEIITNKGFIKVDVRCKDSYHRNFTDKLSIDFKQLSDDMREITFQQSPSERAVEQIASSLRSIEFKLK